MTSYLKIARKRLISLTSSPLQTQFSEAGTVLRKASARVRESSGIVGKARGKKERRGGWGKERKKRGGVGG